MRVPLGVIRFVPDHVEVLSDGSEVIERLRTGRPTKSERDKDIYALYVKAALDAEPRVRRTVQVRYLSVDQVDPLDLRPRTVNTRLNHYNDAISGILRRDFSPEPNDRNCPRCPTTSSARWARTRRRRGHWRSYFRSAASSAIVLVGTSNNTRSHPGVSPHSRDPTSVGERTIE